MVKCSLCGREFMNEWARKMHQVRSHSDKSNLHDPASRKGYGLRKKSVSRKKRTSKTIPQDVPTEIEIRFCPCCGLNLSRLRME